VSDPEGAEVYVNDKFIGKTPCKMENIKSGDYVIILKKNGFIEKTMKQSLTDNLNQRIFIQLEEIVTHSIEDYGRLEVNSTPTGARVLLNGSLKGNTPFISDSIKTGSYFLSITKQKYTSVSETIEIKHNKPKILNVQLFSIDSINFVKKRKKRNLRRIIFGTLGAGFISLGIMAHSKIDGTLKDEEIAWESYKELELDAEEYEKRYNYYIKCYNKTESLINQRNIFYPIGGFFCVGFIISIPF
jgi:hypothetical protein